MEGLTKITAAPTINPTDVVTESGTVLKDVVPEAKGYKKEGSFLPLPEWVREFTNMLGVGDDILLFAFVGFIFILLYLFGFFDQSPKKPRFTTPQTMMSQMAYQMPYATNSPYIQQM